MNVGNYYLHPGPQNPDETLIELVLSPDFEKKLEFPHPARRATVL
jgi:hypothetical protein